MAIHTVQSLELISRIPPTNPPKWKSYRQILVHSLKGSVRGFFISMVMRGGISFLIRLFGIFRERNIRKGLAKAVIASAGVESRRFASMLGLFVFIWKFISNSLYFATKQHRKRNGAIAGAFAGLAVLIETPANRLVVAQQFFMRAMQGGKNALKQRNLFHFKHGDTFLFSIAAASIMYAFVMVPDTIPKDYYLWIVKHGRIPKVLVELNRENTRANQQNIKFQGISRVRQAMEKFNATPENRKLFEEYLQKNGGNYLPNLPCSALHCSENSHSKYCILLFFKTFIDMMPVYFSLNVVPLLLFKFKSVYQDPWRAIKRLLSSTARSCTFLSTYVVMFQSMLCFHRIFFPQRQERFLFYYMGAVTGLSILVENKSKRAELAMYVAPKGIQSLYTLLVANKMIAYIPYLDVVGTCCAMSIIMSLYQKEPHQLSPLMYKIMKGVLGKY